MRERKFGTCASQPSRRAPLRWGSDASVADNICCHNRLYAEYFGYWTSTSFPMALEAGGPSPTVTFYDVVTGLPLFIAPRGRSYEAFVSESTAHGWPSFRDEVRARARSSSARHRAAPPLHVRPASRRPPRTPARPHAAPQEVVAANVRVLPDGETVSVNGTHLGHNLPDGSGNRYCINIVCVAGPA